MSLLTIVQNAARALNIAVPSTVIGNSDLNTALLLRLAQEEGDELSRRHDWQGITIEKTHTTLNQVVQTGAIPSDYDRLVFDCQIWNRTLSQKYVGPVSPNAWQQLQLNLTGGIVGWWRIKAGALNIYPAPTADQTIAFEYVSKNWIDIAATGSPKATWSIDTDIALIPERLIALGVIWRWKQTKGMAYAEELSTYEREVERATTRDKGAKVMRVPTARDDWPQGPTWPGVVSTS